MDESPLYIDQTYVVPFVPFDPTDTGESIPLIHRKTGLLAGGVDEMPNGQWETTIFISDDSEAIAKPFSYYFGNRSEAISILWQKRSNSYLQANLKP